MFFLVILVDGRYIETSSLRVEGNCLVVPNKEVQAQLYGNENGAEGDHYFSNGNILKVVFVQPTE